MRGSSDPTVATGAVLREMGRRADPGWLRDRRHRALGGQRDRPFSCGWEIKCIESIRESFFAERKYATGSRRAAGLYM